MRTYRFWLVLVALFVLCPALARSERGPVLVSPVDAREARVASVCPTFSWAAVDGAVGYELAVFEVGVLPARGEDPPPSEEAVARVALPRGATSWTPNLGSCLVNSRRYAWMVGARLTDEASPVWSAPALIRVEGATAPRVVREAGEAGRPPAASAPLAEESADHRWTGRRQVSSIASRTTKPPSGARAAPAYAPIACFGGPMFSDVPSEDLACPWIEQIAADEILEGCGGGRYCPDNPVTRRQLAVALERVMRGTDVWRPELGNAATVVGPPSPATGGTIGDPDQVALDGRIAMTIGVDGLPIVSLGSHDDEDLLVAHCTDLDCSSATITRLDDPAVDDHNAGGHSSIAIGHDGFPVISYSDETAGLRVAHCSNVACTAAQITTVDAAEPGHHNAIVVPDNGIPLIAYRGEGLKLARCDNPQCTAVAYIATIDDFAGEGISIATVAGQVWISYPHGADGPRVARCGNSTVCDLPGTVLISSLDPGAPAAETSIVIGDDLLPLVSYVRTASDDLMVAHCQDSECSSVERFTVTTDLSFRHSNSIAIGHDGLGLIAYATASNVLFAHCYDRPCSTSRLVSPGINLGPLSLSLSIGADGLPVIALVVDDDDFEYAHVARCPNALCVPFFRRR